MTNIAIENGHLYWIYPLKMVIFHSYVSLPEGNPIDERREAFQKKEVMVIFRFRGNATFITNPCPLISHTPKKPWY
jgi:hypothetical protein